MRGSNSGRACPFLVCIAYASIQQLKQAIFIWESAFGFGEFTELTMHRFNCICGINHFMNVVKPDLIVSSGGQDFIIEVANTHKVDAAKRKKLKKMNIPTLEIDLSEVFQVDGYVDVRLIKEVFTSANTGIKWIIHEAGESLKKEVLEQVRDYSPPLRLTALGEASCFNVHNNQMND